MISIAKLSALTIVGLIICSGAVRSEEMKVGGTGAVHALLERLGQEYTAANPGDSVEAVRGLGSSGGITAAKAGVLQVAVSGRALTPEEQAGKLSSAPFFDTPLIFVSSHPKPQSVTSDDVVRILSGTLTAWPDGKEIRPILRPRSEAAVSALLDGFAGMKVGMDVLRRRPDIPVAATDQDNSDAAQRTANSFATMTLVQFNTERPRLRALPLDGFEGSVEELQKGTYPLKMRLTLVWSAEPSPIALRFLEFLKGASAAAIIRDSGGVAVQAARR